MARTPMKKKNQLPSGSYRVQVYSHADADGKKHYKSFTAPSKKLAQAAANDWLAKRDAGIQTPDDLTVYEAITRYVNVKKGVLSPSTLKEYAGMQKRYFTGTLGSLKLALGDGVEATTDDLGHDGGREDRERQHRDEYVRALDREVDEEDPQQVGRAAEELDVGGDDPLEHAQPARAVLLDEREHGAQDNREDDRKDRDLDRLEEALHDEGDVCRGED